MPSAMGWDARFYHRASREVLLEFGVGNSSVAGLANAARGATNPMREQTVRCARAKLFHLCQGPFDHKSGCLDPVDWGPIEWGAGAGSLAKLATNARSSGGH